MSQGEEAPLSEAMEVDAGARAAEPPMAASVAGAWTVGLGLLWFGVAARVIQSTISAGGGFPVAYGLLATAPLAACGLGAMLLRGHNRARYVFAAWAVVQAALPLDELMGGATRATLSPQMSAALLIMAALLFGKEANAFFSGGRGAGGEPGDRACIWWFALSGAAVVGASPYAIDTLVETISRGEPTIGVVGLACAVPAAGAMLLSVTLAASASGLSGRMRVLSMAPSLLAVGYFVVMLLRVAKYRG